MELKKRLTTFVSNWLGVILAAVIVLVSVTFGGMYLYARSRLDNTINFVTQVITLRYPDGLTLGESVDNPPGYIYHLVLQVYNPFADTVEASISDVSITLDTYAITVVEDGSWSKSTPTGYTIFEGNITIDAQTFTVLVAKGKVDIDIKGTISGSGQYKWIKRQNQRSFNILIHGVLFKLNPVSSSNATTS
jgi:hypothetical protein